MSFICGNEAFDTSAMSESLQSIPTDALTHSMIHKVKHFPIFDSQCNTPNRPNCYPVPSMHGDSSAKTERDMIWSSGQNTVPANFCQRY